MIGEDQVIVASLCLSQTEALHKLHGFMRRYLGFILSDSESVEF